MSLPFTERTAADGAMAALKYDGGGLVEDVGVELRLGAAGLVEHHHIARRQDATTDGFTAGEGRDVEHRDRARTCRRASGERGVLIDHGVGRTDGARAVLAGGIGPHSA